MARLVLIVFLPFAGGYFLSYLFRSTNAVIAPQLVSEIGLSAGDLGLLTSVYFLAFASFQLPLGMLLDRFGPRRVQSVLLLSSAIGSAGFAMGDSFLGLLISRALIGLGVAGGLMSAFKAITLWFPKERWPLINGCFLATGGVGAIFATTPLEWGVSVSGWREVFWLLALLTLFAAATIRIVVPDKEIEGTPQNFHSQFAALAVIFKDRLFWKLVPLTVVTSTANMAIQGLWAGPWLRDVAEFDRVGVADYLLVIAVVMTIGSIVTGVVADWLEKRGVSLLMIFACMTLFFMLALLSIVLELAPMSVLPWIGFALFANCAMLVYAVLNRHFPLAYAGRVSTATNTIAFFGAFAGQYLLGAVIDLWPLAPDGGYLNEAYQWAFGGLLALQFLSWVWLLIAPTSPAKEAR